MNTSFIENSKGRFEFQELANVAYPCPACGVPACGKETVFWNENMKCIVIEGSFFETLLNKVIEKMVRERKELSDLLVQCSTCTGWTEEFAYKLKVADLKEALEFIDNLEIENYLKDYVPEQREAFLKLFGMTAEDYIMVDRG